MFEQAWANHDAPIMTYVKRPVYPLLAALAAVSLSSGCGQRDGGKAAATASRATAVVWAVGDAADREQEGRHLARRIVRERPRLFLYLGDVYDRGTAREFRRHYDPLYGAIAARTIPVAGNHEWAARATGYFPYWRRKQGRAPANNTVRRLAGWEILTLNSELDLGKGSPQWRWLRDRLARRTSCRIVALHRPRFSAGEVHGDAPDLADAWALFPGRVRLALAAHEHDSQRLRDWRGVTPLVAGAGSAVLYRLRRSDRRLAFGDDRRIAGLRLELQRGWVRYAFVGADGRRLHAGSARCR